MIGKIDLVYLWVDSADPKWVKKINSFSEKELAIVPERYRDNDELKYSLRSIEKFAPWVNKIYIVTDEQVPEWLNTDNEKVRIVDHKEIIPSEFLPCFNSIVIELYLDKIPNLSEYFIYANDDMMLGNHVEPSYFFNEDGVPNNLFGKARFLKKGSYGVKHVRYFIDRDRKDIAKFKLLHNVTPYRKSSIIEIKEKFKDDVIETSKKRFRGEFYIHRFFFTMYDIYQKRASCFIQKRFPVWLWFKLKHAIGLKPNMLHFETYNEFEKNVKLLRYIKKYKPYTFCLNDTEKNKEDGIDMFKGFFREYFPEKSSFEK